MKEANVQVTNETGLHARPAAQVVQVATKFKSQIYAFKDGKKADTKSLVDLLGLGICQNDQLTIRAEGKDESRAIEQLVSLIKAINNT
ncbi:MAG TPA: phosphocarrier protein HPr [Firmicutes bacterium]|jgi:phosphocarrier protein HPr|nr:phosphocarrier protein HPr [Bacillota bacterium]